MKIVHSFLLCAAIGLSAAQAVRQLEIYTEETVITNFHLAEDETLEIVYYVDPISLEFRDSTLRRIPTGLFSRNTLERFVANGASISEIHSSDFTNAVNLATMDLNNNLINKLDANLLENAPELGILFLNFNEISEIDVNTFAGNSMIRQLTLYGNHLTSLPATVFKPLVNLILLDLGLNHISEITFGDFSEHPRLRYFIIEHNELTTLENVQLVSPTLRFLNLNGNKLERIPANAFVGVELLQLLFIGNNNIKEIDESAFTGLDVLLQLRLFLNEIETLPASVFQPLRIATLIDLGSNAIKDITFATFSSMSTVVNLFLEDNQLENFDISMLVSMKSLRALHLHSNQLQRLNLKDAKFVLPNLATISVFNNNWECRELSRIIRNIRQHELLSYISELQIESESIRLDGIGCTDNGELAPPVILSKQRDIARIHAEKLQMMAEFYGEIHFELE